MTRPPKTYPSKRFAKMLAKASDANFDAGEWDRNESDEDYDDVHARAIKADLAIVNYVASLERARDAVLATIRAYSKQCDRVGYTDSGALWDTVFPNIVATLKNAGRKTP